MDEIRQYALQIVTDLARTREHYSNSDHVIKEAKQIEEYLRGAKTNGTKKKK